MIWHLNLVPPFLEDPDTIPQHTKESNFLPYLVIFRSSHPKNRHLQLKVYRIVLFSCQSDILQAIQQTLSTPSFSQDKIYFLFGLRAHLHPQSWDKLPKTSQKNGTFAIFFWKLRWTGTRLLVYKLLEIWATDMCSAAHNCRQSKSSEKPLVKILREQSISVPHLWTSYLDYP